MDYITPKLSESKCKCLYLRRWHPQLTACSCSDEGLSAGSHDGAEQWGFSKSLQHNHSRRGWSLPALGEMAVKKLKKTKVLFVHHVQTLDVNTCWYRFDTLSKTSENHDNLYLSFLTCCLRMKVLSCSTDLHGFNIFIYYIINTIYLLTFPRDLGPPNEILNKVRDKRKGKEKSEQLNRQIGIKEIHKVSNWIKCVFTQLCYICCT